MTCKRWLRPRKCTSRMLVLNCSGIRFLYSITSPPLQEHTVRLGIFSYHRYNGIIGHETSGDDWASARAARATTTISEDPSSRFIALSNKLGQPRSLKYHFYTLWLIVRSDLKSIVLPETLFGICSALAAPLTTNANPTAADVLSRLPHVIIWNLMHVLLFDIANQRLPNSIIEDSVNKAWRPIPTGRVSPDEARRLLLIVVPIVFISSLFLGGVLETVGLIILTWMYNDLGGADEVYIIRNIINAMGFMCYSSGSLDVAAGNYVLTPRAYTWIAIVGGIIFSTLSMQDLPDVIGDAVRGRKTSPLIMGDAFSRWEIAIPIFFWSIVCPMFWRATLLGWGVSLSVGVYLAFRILSYRNIAADKKSWQTWCLWTGTLYVLPLLAKA
jgi:4-hydroxybenzoate polyprenyltransferase